MLKKDKRKIKIIVNSHLLAHLQTAQANTKSKLAKEPASRQPEKNFKIFSPTLKEKIKTPDTQANDRQQNKFHSGLDTAVQLGKHAFTIYKIVPKMEGEGHFPYI